MSNPSVPQSPGTPTGGSSAEPTPAQVFMTAFKSLWKAPAFLLMFSILLVSTIGLNAATGVLKLHFRKQPVSLQKTLLSLPKTIGPWQQVSIDMPLSPDIQEVLGTDKYIFRDYVDTRVVPPSRLAEFDKKDYKARQALADQIRGQYPTGIISLSVTYYTGMVDTVAHIPDRCFIADGFRPTNYETPRWPINGLPVDDEGYHLDAKGQRLSAFPQDGKVYQGGGLPVRFINFEDQDVRTRARIRNVTYFFQVNGRYEANPLGVRSTLQDLFQKNGYYSKVELMTLLPDLAKSAAMKRDFLSYALPELEQCFPNWADVLAGKAPTAPVSGWPTTQATTQSSTQPSEIPIPAPGAK